MSKNSARMNRETQIWVEQNEHEQSKINTRRVKLRMSIVRQAKAMYTCKTMIRRINKRLEK